MKKGLLILFLAVSPLLGYMQTSVKASEIIQKLNNGESVSYENVTVSGDLDFRLIKDKEKYNDSKMDVIFKDNTTYRYHVNKSLQFKNCEFLGNIIGYYHDDDEDELHIVMFHGDVNFEACTFNRNLLVKYTEFYKNASFKGNIYEGDALFK